MMDRIWQLMMMLMRMSCGCFSAAVVVVVVIYVALLLLRRCICVEWLLVCVLRVFFPNSMPPNEHYDFVIALLTTTMRTNRMKKWKNKFNTMSNKKKEQTKSTNELDIKTQGNGKVFFFCKCYALTSWFNADDKINQMFELDLCTATGLVWMRHLVCYFYNVRVHKDTDRHTLNYRNEQITEQQSEWNRLKEMRFASTEI